MKNHAVAKELVGMAEALLSGSRTGAVGEKFNVIVDWVEMEVVEDNWEKGEIGNPSQVYHKKNFGTFADVSQAVAAVSREIGIPTANFFVNTEGEDDGVVEGNGMVDENNSYVGDDKRFQERFKNGEVRAWTAEVTMSIRFAKTWVPTPQEIKQTSGLQEG